MEALKTLFNGVTIGQMAKQAYEAHARLTAPKVTAVPWEALDRPTRLVWLAVACAVLRRKAAGKLEDEGE